MTFILDPLPYHREMVALLRADAPALWEWHARTRLSQQRVEEIRLDLLKSTYRLERAAHADLYERIDVAAKQLGLAVQITCYQAQAPGGSLNASLWYLPEEAHVVLQGPLLTTLAGDEIGMVVAHELGHFLLWSHDDGVYGIADRVLHAMADDPRAEASHLQTLRRWRLATEIFADRAALAACGHLATVVGTLVRLETGAASVDADSYLKQADEVLASNFAGTEGTTHPECFIRAAALAAVARGDSDAEARVERLVLGSLDPRALDLLGQRRCTALTRLLIETVLEPPWLRSDSVLAHARLFFPEAAPPGNRTLLDQELSGAGPGLRDYVCSILVDFAAADPDLGDAALAHGFVLANRWGWAERFGELCHRDLKLKAKELAHIRDQAEVLTAAAGAQAALGVQGAQDTQSAQGAQGAPGAAG